MLEDKASSPSSGWLLPGILAGIFAGALFGGLAPAWAVEVRFLGDLFIHALMMMVVPLIITSMVVGISNLGDVRQLGTLGLRTLGFFFFSTALAVLIGLTLVFAVQPGRGVSSGESLPGAVYSIEGDQLRLEGGARFSRWDYDGRFLLTLADQPITATLAGEGAMTEGSLKVLHWRETRWVSPWQAASLLGISEEELRRRVARGELVQEEQGGRLRVRVTVSEDEEGRPVTPSASGVGLTLGLPVAARVEAKETSIVKVLTQVLVGLVPTNLFRSMAETEVLPLIAFSLFLGGVLSTLGPSGRPVLVVFQGLNDAIMKMVHLLMFTAPIGIFALIAARLGEAGGWAGFLPELARLARYAGTVMLALALHGLVVLPLMLRFGAGRSPWRFLRGMLPALTTAFSTSSSSASLPVTMECLEENHRLSNRTVSFVVPLGATINMNGTALYEAVAAVFIAQLHGIELGPVQLVIVFLTSTLAAVGAAGIPEAGLVTMVIVLKAVGLPLSGISMILVIDWFLDRCRTAVNVWGDAVGAAWIDRLEAPPSAEGPALAEHLGR